MNKVFRWNLKPNLISVHMRIFLFRRKLVILLFYFLSETFNTFFMSFFIQFTNWTIETVSLREISRAFLLNFQSSFRSFYKKNCAAISVKYFFNEVPRVTNLDRERNWTWNAIIIFKENHLHLLKILRILNSVMSLSVVCWVFTSLWMSNMLKRNRKLGN